MALLLELFISLLAAFGLVCLSWLIFGRMVLPIGGENTRVRAEVTACGHGEGLELALSGLLWLRRSGLWRGTVTIRDEGLTPEGKRLAQRLARQPGVELHSPEEPDK